jgi:hemoglobin/transferrin/lactoferrin receptor protein
MSLERSYRNENVDVFSFNGDFIVPVSKKENTALTYGFEFLYNEVSFKCFRKKL